MKQIILSNEEEANEELMWQPTAATATTMAARAANCCCNVIGVTLSATTVTLEVNECETLVATVAPDDATDNSVRWSSDDERVATVSASGLVCAKKAGTATITVETNDGGFTASCEVTVKQPVTGVSISKTSLSLEVNGSDTLTATVLPSAATNKKVTWSSDNEVVATVSNSGLVCAKKAGTATITVETEEGGFEKTCIVTVEQPVTGVNISKTSLSLEVNGSDTLIATVEPPNASNTKVAWFSDNEAVATVSSGGLVCAKKEGTATITVETEDGGFTETCTVTVQEVVTAGFSKLSVTSYSSETDALELCSSTNEGEDMDHAIELVEGKIVQGIILGDSYSNVPSPDGEEIVLSRTYVYFQFVPTKKAYHLDFCAEGSYTIQCSIQDSDNNYIFMPDTVEAPNYISLDLELEAHKTYYFCVSVTQRTGRVPIYASLVCTNSEEVLQLNQSGRILSENQPIALSVTPETEVNWSMNSTIANLSANKGASVTLTTNGDKSGIVTVTASKDGISKSCEVIVLEQSQGCDTGIVKKDVEIRRGPGVDYNVIQSITKDIKGVVRIKGFVINNIGEKWYYIALEANQNLMGFISDQNLSIQPIYLDIAQLSDDKYKWSFREIIGYDLNTFIPTYQDSENGRDLVEADISELNVVLHEYGINTQNRICHFLAQCYVESGGGFLPVERFNGDDPIEYFRKYEIEGNHFGNRVNSGDGAKYRGAGAIQITGRDAYTDFSQYVLDEKILNDGAVYVGQNYFWESSAYYWSIYKPSDGFYLNKKCDEGASVATITRIVTGKENVESLPEREAAYNHYSNIIHIS